MFRFITPIILIGVSVGGFFMFTDPLFKEVSSLKKNVVAYDEALSNSKVLESERDKLTQKYNEITPDTLDKLQKFLPDNVDNIRLILEIEKIASPYGMVLKDVKYDTTGADATAVSIKGGVNTQSNKEYGVWNLEFSTQGTYSNFLNFIKDLENNLRIVDISSVQFTSDSGNGLNSNQSSSSYKYGFKIKTYWLKN
ncbi:type 4a pilus biogenesis protein PilO [Candidatus Nomurabacteria bacterium]|nr:type 4a pilus biogenesis protein PilO [Candidatus Nomurabacteria bacterium]